MSSTTAPLRRLAVALAAVTAVLPVTTAHADPQPTGPQPAVSQPPWPVSLLSELMALVPSAMQPAPAASTAPTLGETACYRVHYGGLKVRYAPKSHAKVVDHRKWAQIVRASVETTNGYRQLGPDQWANAGLLKKVDTTSC